MSCFFFGGGSRRVKQHFLDVSSYSLIQSSKKQAQNALKMWIGSVMSHNLRRRVKHGEELDCGISI